MRSGFISFDFSRKVRVPSSRHLEDFWSVFLRKWEISLQGILNQQCFKKHRKKSSGQDLAFRCLLEEEINWKNFWEGFSSRFPYGRKEELKWVRQISIFVGIECRYIEAQPEHKNKTKIGLLKYVELVFLLKPLKSDWNILKLLNFYAIFLIDNTISKVKSKNRFNMKKAK